MQIVMSVKEINKNKWCLNLDKYNVDFDDILICNRYAELMDSMEIKTKLASIEGVFKDDNRFYYKTEKGAREALDIMTSLSIAVNLSE